MNENIEVGHHDKPTAYESPNSYDYNLITDREFEELLHSIFELRIQSEPRFINQFTDAYLLNGVGEQGRDVILMNGDLRAGLIQCKKVNTNLTKPACAQEIIKFGIHAVLNDRLISPQGFPFTYFFAVSKGFSNTAIDLLSSFNSRILDEGDYRVWVDKILNSYEEFKSRQLKYEDVSESLYKILIRLQVKMIIPSKLNLWLSIYPALVSRFFRVKTIETGSQRPIPQTTYRSAMTAELISERFRAASSTLRHYPSSFGSLNYHIDRVETDKLLLWIKTPLKQKQKSTKPPIEYVAPIAVLTGDAGYGKTVVMRDLLSRLIHESIPTLAIKADKSTFNRQQELVSELHLGDDLIKQAYTLSDKYERIVIIVDQLDALSQHLSANREPLKMYNRLIEQLANIPNVRLVIACRRFDLQYDPSLVQYHDKHIVKLELLSREHVQAVFVQLNLSPNTLTKSLYDVLSVPLHLTLFCKVHKQITDFTQLRSVQDLYHELWKQKIITATAQADTVDVKRVVELVRMIANKMNDLQEIHVAHRLYEMNYSNELFYLRSEGIINVEDTELQFLHQSFFDYVYARTFVDDGRNLAEEIAGTSQSPKHQGLFVRSKVRQILLYLREVDPRMYQQQVKDILTSLTFRFHIKLLVLQSLAFQKDPTLAELRLAETIIFKEPLLRDAFLESLSSSDWLRFLNKKQLIQPLLIDNYILGNTLLYPLCNRINPIDQTGVVDFLMNLPEFPQVHEFITLVLRGFEDFEDTRCLTLFENVVKNQPLNDFPFYHIVEKATSLFPDWVSPQVWLRLLPKLEVISVSHNNYLPGKSNDIIGLMNKLHKAAPETAIDLVLRILVQIIERTRLEDRHEQIYDLYSDLAFMFYIPDLDERHDKHYELDTKLRTWLIDLKLTSYMFVKQKVEWLISQKATSLISIGLQVIHAYPNDYAEQFLSRLTAGNFITHFNDVGSEYFRFSVREALRLCFPFFTAEQKQILAHQILTIKPLDEGPKKRPIGLSLYNLLIVLPNDFINTELILKSKLQQLKRRFKALEHEIPKGVQLMPAPVLPDNAYANMDDDQWINSFIKYDTRKEQRWNGVDQFSHAQRFSIEVTKNPSRFVTLIDRIIDDKSIPDLYIYQGLDGLVKGEYNPEVFKILFLKAISRTDEDYYQLQLVWLTLYLVNNNIFDEQIFAFLQAKALIGSQEDTNDGKALERGINQTRGAAAGPLVKYAEQIQFKERVFDTLEKSAESASISTRAAILNYHIILNSTDKKRNLKLFIRLCAGYETELARVAANSLEYHINIEFEPLIPFFEKAIKAEDAADSLTRILTNAYMFGYSGSERLLNMYISISAKNVASCVSHALDFLASLNPNYQQKGLLIANRFLTEDHSEIVQAYRYGFDDLTVKHFPIVSEFLFAYVQSKVGQQRDGNFYSYLLKCVQEYPDDCLKLVEFFDNHDGPDITERVLEQEPVEVVLQAYNAYKKYDEPNESLDRAMDLFDCMLKIPEYRKEARKAANDI